ncbi:unnamed protein product [Aureobasidium pullulans]|nr:unnamed protein product [Aureobasidium pullulans]
MWHTRTERPRSSVESYRSLNELVTARLNRFLIEEDEYPKRYNIWQQHNLEIATLKDAMLDDTAAAECQRKLPAALKVGSRISQKVCRFGKSLLPLHRRVGVQSEQKF